MQRLQQRTKAVEAEPGGATMHTPNSVLEAAIGYAQRGWPVLPVHYLRRDGSCSCRRGADCHSPAKHPVAKLVRHGLIDATTDERTIRDWFAPGIFPSSPLGVGIKTGAISELLIVDVDPRNKGRETLLRLVDEHGRLPRTRTVRSRSGGRHYYFSFPYIDHYGRLDDGIDLKGEGGYIIAPPSAGYALVHDAPIADAPDWVLERATRLPLPAPVAAASVESPRLSDRIQLLLRSERNLRLLWENRGRTSGDTSKSGYDLAIAHELLRLEVPLPDVKLAIAARPRGHRPGDTLYAARTATAAYAWRRMAA